MSADGAFRFSVNIMENFTPSLSQVRPHITPPVLRKRPYGGELEIPSKYQLNDRDFELVTKFQSRTVFTISNAGNIDIYLDHLIKLGCSVGSISPYGHPY